MHLFFYVMLLLYGLTYRHEPVGVILLVIVGAITVGAAVIHFRDE